MKTPLTLILPILLFFAFFQPAAPPLATAPEEPAGFCAQHDLHRQKAQRDEAYRRASQRVENLLYAAARQPAARRGLLVRHTLPVVFHIVHDNGGENISDAQVAEALQHLNDAFANVGYYNPATGVDTEIAFCLARRDPGGAATTGINRVQSSLTELNYNIEDQALKNLIRWAPRQYINIWVVREICNNNGCGVAGYAYLPGAHGQPYDGIVLEARYTGSSPSRSTVLAHEMGHYLGLYHTFEGGCPNADCQLSGDRICDTPPDNTTAATPCDADMNSCSTDEDDPGANNPFRPAVLGGLGDQPDQKENYMDYSRLECYDRFTQGQKDRMLAVVENIRSSLLDSPACIGPCPDPQVAAFSAGAVSVPVGTTIIFTNSSINADSYEWQIDGVIFSTATDASYEFTTEGTYQVTLTAFSSLGNCLPQDSTLAIEVFCPVQASFSASATSVLAGATITFTNTSANADSYTWRINGTVAGAETDFQLNTTQPGQFNVCLTAGNGLCESVYCLEVAATLPSVGGCGPSYFFTIGLPGDKARGRVLEPAADGGYYLGGSLNGQPLLLKFSQEGEMEWQYLLPFSNNEEVWDLVEDEEGFLFGSTRQEGNLNGSYYFKFGPQGQSLLWANAFTSFPEYRFYKLLSRADIPYYIILGESEANPLVLGPGCDATFITVDKTTGQLLNQRNIGLGACDYFRNAVLAEGAIYATGTFTDGSGDGAVRPAIAKLSFDGEQQWPGSRLYLAPLPGFPARLYGQDILLDGDELVVAGQGDFGGISTSDVLCALFKTDMDGNILWARQMDIAGAREERVEQLLQVEDGYLLIGNYIRSGTNNDSDVFFIKTDPDGTLRWAKVMANTGNETVFHEGAFVRDGLVYLTGSLVNADGIQAFVLRLTSDGQLSGGCQELLPIDLEFADMQNPYDGPSNAHDYDFIRSDSLFSLSPRPTQLLTANFCGAPCEECANGLDDDGDGLVDCEDEDCPCFADCGGAFAELIGTSGQDEGALTIIPSGDGNFFVGGYAGEEAAILKMAPDGGILWQRTFDFSEGSDQVRALIRGDDGYLYGSNSNTHATVFCYDPENDAVLWSNTIYNVARLNNISINPTNGNILACGGLAFPSSDPVLVNEFTGTLYPQFDIAVTAEFERNTGALNWRREYQAGSSSTCYEMEWIGDVYYSPARFTHNAGQPKMRPNIAAFSANGEIAWSKQYIRPAGATARMYAFCMEKAPDGLVTGFLGDPNGTDLYGASRTGLFKTDFAGNLQWARWYTLDGYDAALGAFGMTSAPDGYLLYGYAVGSSRDLTVIKTDEEGNALWAMAYGGPGDEDLAFNSGSPILLAGSSIYIVGRSRGSGTEDMILIRASAGDGTIPGDDCGYAMPIPISTELLPDAVEAPAGLSETPFSGIAPQLNAVQPAPGSLDTTVLCASSPVDALVALDSVYCNGDSLAVALRLCNEGTDTLPAGLPFTFYDGNPTADPAAVVLAGGFTLPAAILPGGCFTTTVAVPYPQGLLYCIANDDGSLPPVFNLAASFPVTDIIECDYTNNIDSTDYDTIIPPINLGPDTSVCENGVFRLDAGPGFAAYRWQDGAGGQTYTAFEAGTYWVEAATACGDVVSDTIEIRLDTAILIGLPPDTSVCPGATVGLSTPQDAAYTYQWSPAAGLSCADCPTPTAMPDTATTYTLVVSNATGCFSVDSLTISVENCGATLDTALCLGDSLLIEGQLFYPGQSDTLQLPDGASLFVNVSALDTFYLFLELGVCAGETVEYGGLSLQAGQSEQFRYTTAAGCDSIVEATALRLDTFFTAIDTALCQGESLAYNGALLQPGQSEIFTFAASNGCDSSVLVSVHPLDTALVFLEVESCFGEAYSFNGQELPPGSAAPFTFTGANGCDSTVVLSVTSLEDIQTAESMFICQGEVGYVFGQPVAGTGIYSETYTSYQGCDSTHTIYFVVQDTAALAVQPGYLGCGGSAGSLTVAISGGIPPYRIQWSDGQTTATAEDLSPGFYSVTVTDGFGCRSVAFGQVYGTISRPAADPVAMPASCFGGKDGSVLLSNPSGGTPPYEYSLDGERWQAGNRFTGLESGTYIVFIRDKEQCEESFPVTVGEPAPLSILLPPDTTLRPGDSIRIAPIVLSGAPSAYEWAPPSGLDCTDCPAPVARPAESIRYRLIVRDSSGCTGSDELLIDVDATVRSYLPSAFSPNGDGRNDFFTVYAAPEVEQVQTLRVFSRWGELVFRRDNFAPNREDLGWNGSFRGTLLPAGVYACYAELLLKSGRVAVVKGEVALVR